MTPQQQAFIEELYQKNFNKIYVYVNSVLQEHERAKKIVQEIFCEACRHIETLMTHEKPDTWLIKTAKDKLRAYVRSASSGLSL